MPKSISIFAGTFKYVHGQMSLVHNAKGSCTSLANGSSHDQYTGYGDCIQCNLLPDMSRVLQCAMGVTQLHSLGNCD